MKDRFGNEHSEKDGKFVSQGAGTPAEQKRFNELTGSSENKMTASEKIESIHIDFTRDNILPELNEEDLIKVGAIENKKVLLKKNIIDRNSNEHCDLTMEDFEKIIKQTLYSPSEIFKANNDRPYYHFAKPIKINEQGKSEIGLALLEVNNTKECFEIVHAYFVNVSGFERSKRRTNKKD